MVTFWNGSKKREFSRKIEIFYRTNQTRKQVQAIIDAIDINDDGEVDYQEFLVSTHLQ